MRYTMQSEQLRALLCPAGTAFAGDDRYERSESAQAEQHSRRALSDVPALKGRGSVFSGAEL